MKIEIPMELVELEDNSYHLIVPVQIGSIEGDFIIDTGASVTVVDRHTPFSHEPLEGVTEVNSGSVGGQQCDVGRQTGVLAVEEYHVNQNQHEGDDERPHARLDGLFTQ